MASLDDTLMRKFERMLCACNRELLFVYMCGCVTVCVCVRACRGHCCQIECDYYLSI